MSGSTPCPECGTAIPAGRLACPSCGALLASVRHNPPEHRPGVEDDDVDAERLDPDLLAMTSAAPDPSAAEAAPIEAAPLDDDAVAGGLSSGGIVPGAYLPPSTVHRPALPPADGGYVAPAPAYTPPAPQPPSWVASSTAPSIGSAAATGPSTAAAAATGAVRDETRPMTPGKASILADLPFDAPDELEGWLVALGAGTGILGFFLPWHAALDFGLAGYFGSWGLGIASNLPMFALCVVTLVLAVYPNRVAEWFRYGVLGMVGGGILFGVVWLYIGGGAEIGAIFAAVGAMLLIFGGVLAVSPSRAARRTQAD